MRYPAAARLLAHEAKALVMEQSLFFRARYIQPAFISRPRGLSPYRSLYRAACHRRCLNSASALWTDMGRGVNLMIQGFLLGIIATSSIMAGIFFLKFWKRTRDFLFIAFAVAFIIEGGSRASVLLLEKPNEGSPWIYLVRLLASLLILFAILKKNYGVAR